MAASALLGGVVSDLVGIVLATSVVSLAVFNVDKGGSGSHPRGRFFNDNATTTLEERLFDGRGVTLPWSPVFTLVSANVLCVISIASRKTKSERERERAS